MRTNRCLIKSICSGPTLFTNDAQATSNDKSFNVLFATLAAEDLTTSHYRSERNEVRYRHAFLPEGDSVVAYSLIPYIINLY